MKSNNCINNRLKKRGWSEIEFSSNSIVGASRLYIFYILAYTHTHTAWLFSEYFFNELTLISQCLILLNRTEKKVHFVCIDEFTIISSFFLLLSFFFPSLSFFPRYICIQPLSFSISHSINAINHVSLTSMKRILDI